MSAIKRLGIHVPSSSDTCSRLRFGVFGSIVAPVSRRPGAGTADIAAQNRARSAIRVPILIGAAQLEGAQQTQSEHVLQQRLCDLGRCPAIAIPRSQSSLGHVLIQHCG